MEESPSFDEIWRRCAGQIRRGEGKVDIATGETPNYSLVARLGDDIGEVLHRTANAMGIAEQGHYVYPPGDIHFTILNLTPYLTAHQGDRDGSTCSAVTVAQGVLDDVFQTQRPFEFAVHGLNLFPTTIPAQLYPKDRKSISRLRVTLARRLEAAGLVGSGVQKYEDELYWNICFANVVRFMKKASVEIVDRVAERRETEFGNVTLSEVEFVKTDKFLSERHTELIRLLSLRQPPTGEETVE